MKLSDDLVLDARILGEAMERSIASQIEFWARLGQALEPLLNGDQVLALSKAGKAMPLSACLESVDSDEGRRRVSAYLKTRPFPHYEPAPGSPGLLVQVQSDGTRTLGRFVRRKFQPAKRRP